MSSFTASAPPPPQNELKFYCFIGRLNPPHEGHIYSLMQVIRDAIEHNTTAMIFLGSGGNKRTLDDPMEHEDKVDVVGYLLDRFLRNEGVGAAAIPKEATATQKPSHPYQLFKYGGDGGVKPIEKFVEMRDAVLARGKIDVLDIKIFSSTKDDDDKGRAFFIDSVKKSLGEEMLSEKYEDVKSTGISIKGIEPLNITDPRIGEVLNGLSGASGHAPPQGAPVALSATSLRRLIYKNILTGDNDWFLENDYFREFYGDKIAIVYDAIKTTTEKLYGRNEDELRENLEYYIEHKTIMKKSRAAAAVTANKTRKTKASTAAAAEQENVSSTRTTRAKKPKTEIGGGKRRKSKRLLAVAAARRRGTHKK